ncbi:MAG: phosphoribosylamine--glycine ligase [Kofleriaceae bacterium]|nr:phosphoribosylamine--glycine ligase [Kofleriaceae bacterium]MCL4227897.1 phosphoribosylamine--glycine ligase [Myxococcales bacterium]
MKILVVGSGGREHALAWQLARGGHVVLVAPGNPGIEAVAACVAVATDDLDGLVALATARAVDLVVVGPEAPLCAGLADRLRAAGVPTFGPGAAGAALEGSKAFSKQLFARAGIRTAAFEVCATIDEADLAIARLLDRDGVVVKADGLAAGKGVVVAADAAVARAAARDMLGGRFGAAGARLVIEQRLRGREVSVLALTDGERLEVLAPAEDHKTLHDGDLGPNTGGMGTVSPAWIDDATLARVTDEVLAPTLAGLAAEGIDYRGVLYAGLMIDEGGAPWLLEYNCRMGDPETQPVMARLRGDLGAVLHGAATGALPAGALSWDPRAAVCVVVAAAGYPGTPRTGDPIGGLAAAGDVPDVVVFHAGTARRGDAVVSAGGRVLGVTALGADVDEARARAYAAVERIELPGKQYRTDIGLRGRAR